MIQQLQAELAKLTKEQVIAIMPVIGATCTALGALLGVVLTTAVTFYQGFLTRRAEREKHIRELAVNAAVEQWKAERSRADARNETGTVKSLRLRIASFLKFSEVLNRTKVTADDISKNIADSDAIIAAAETGIKTAK